MKVSHKGCINVSSTPVYARLQGGPDLICGGEERLAGRQSEARIFATLRLHASDRNSEVRGVMGAGEEQT